jgi:hypothetical protein
MSKLSALCIALFLLCHSTAWADKRDDGVRAPGLFQFELSIGEQDSAYRDTRQGLVRSLKAVEAAIVPRMTQQGARYLGAEYFPRVFLWRLKFIRGNAIVWVDVDARRGVIVSKSGE